MKYEEGSIFKKLKDLKSSQLSNLKRHLYQQLLISLRLITRCRRTKGKVESLIEQAADRSRVINNACLLSNLMIKIHGWYIQIGHVKDEKDRIRVEEYFKSNLPDVTVEQLRFFRQVIKLPVSQPSCRFIKSRSKLQKTHTKSALSYILTYFHGQGAKPAVNHLMP